MAHVNKVLRSFNDEGACRCVDLFKRPDGSYGFEEYRRDVEDGRGWFAVGGFGDRVFQNELATIADASSAVPWLTEVLNDKHR